MVTVIKVGGSILQNGTDYGLLDSIIKYTGDSKVLVHGGGPVVTDLCRDLGIEPRFIVSPDGIRSRLTDLDTINAYIMAMRGTINSQLVLALQKNGVPAAGISGIDGPTLLAERKKRLVTINEKGRKMFVDGGYTGRIVRTDTGLLQQMVNAGITPVVSPIAMSLEYEPLNVDGDRAASAIAGSLKADRLFLLTNVDGVILDGELMKEIRSSEIPAIMKKVGNGMDKKLMAAGEALAAGCSEVVISNGRTEDPLGVALNTENRTLIKN